MIFYSNKNYLDFGSSRPYSSLSVSTWKVAVISLCLLHHVALTLTSLSAEPDEQAPGPKTERGNRGRKPIVEATDYAYKFQIYKKGKLEQIQYFAGNLGPLYTRRRRDDNEQDRMNWKTPELIRNADPALQVHRHHVTTKDNYKLTLFRIRNRKCGVNPRIFPVLFQHGLMGTSDDFLLLDPDYSLPIGLARTGHDVWLSNSRGNEYSKSHEYLNTYDPRYWNFSFHEMGNYDLPIFEFINQTSKPTQVGTRSEKGLIYIGHGLGTTLLYVCLSQNPEYNRYIKFFNSLGPIAFMSKSRSPLRNLIPLIKHYQKFPKDGPVSFIAIKDYLYGAAPELCTVKKYGRGLCGPEIFTFLPDGSSQIRKETVPVILAHPPSSTSWKTLIHFLQLLDADYFREFDYGPIKNFKRYNQTTPRKYDLFRVIVTSFNFYGQADNLIEQKDAEKTVDRLGIQLEKFNTLLMNSSYADFLYSEIFFATQNRILYSLPGLASFVETVVGAVAPGIEGTGPIRNTTKLISDDTSSCSCPRDCVEDQGQYKNQFIHNSQAKI